MEVIANDCSCCQGLFFGLIGFVVMTDCSNASYMYESDESKVRALDKLLKSYGGGS